jgi:hypothetical protein
MDDRSGAFGRNLRERLNFEDLGIDDWDNIETDIQQVGKGK